MDSKKKKTIYDQAMEVRKADLNEHLDKINEIERENEEKAKNAKAHIPEDIKSDFDLKEIKADLSLFELKDFGSDTLKVYHPAIDIGSELGIINKAEYGKLKDKEAFFKSVLENQASAPEIAEKHILAFEGEFKEPTISIDSVKEIVTSKDYEEDKEEKKEEEKKEEEKEAELDTSLPKAKMADGFEQSLQAETNKTESDYNKLSTNIVNSLYNQLKHDMRYDSVNILKVNYNDDKTALNVYTSLHDKVGEKVVSLDIPVEGLEFKPLSNSTIASIVAKTTDLATQITSEMQNEISEKMKVIDAEEAWKSGDVQNTVEAEEIVDKERFVEEKYKDHNVSEDAILDAMDGIGLESSKPAVKKEAAADSVNV